jgi:hypothetical protein
MGRKNALEIRERARRRRGELLLALKASGQLRHGGARSSDDDLGLADKFRALPGAAFPPNPKAAVPN